jgi:hypothetical protein
MIEYLVSFCSLALIVAIAVGAWALALEMVAQGTVFRGHWEAIRNNCRTATSFLLKPIVTMYNKVRFAPANSSA